jgi:hypothetical protein
MRRIVGVDAVTMLDQARMTSALEILVRVSATYEFLWKEWGEALLVEGLILTVGDSVL